MTDATQVRIGITGALYKAPPGTAVPADSGATLDAAFVNLGYLSEDGITENWEDSVDDVVAWQSATTVRSSTTESKLSLELTMIETNKDVLETFHRGSTMATVSAGEYRLDVVPATADPSIWVFDVIDGSRRIRLLFNNGEITARGAVPYANGSAVMYPVTLQAYPDANGFIIQKFSNDAAWTP